MALKRIMAVFFILIFALSSSGQAGKQNKVTVKWHTNILEAQKVSNELKKPIFAFFTGSDWCGWCHRLQSNVLLKKSFIDWANKNVVLLELDYPRKKQLSPELQRQNAELQQVFNVMGFPTVWLFYLTDDAVTKKKNIDALGSLGYPSNAESGKEDVAFLHTADSLLHLKRR